METTSCSHGTIRLLVWLILSFHALEANVIPSGALYEGRDSSLPEDTCGNPIYEVIKGELLRNYDAIDQLYYLSPFAEASSIPTYERPHHSAYINNTGECSFLRMAFNSRGGTTCPGRYTLNRDTERVPCVMWEFKCVCRNCLIPNEVQREHNPLRSAPCKPIYHNVPVMRRQQSLNGGLSDWKYVLEPIAVGCACMPRVWIHSTH